MRIFVFAICAVVLLSCSENKSSTTIPVAKTPAAKNDSSFVWKALQGNRVDAVKLLYSLKPSYKYLAQDTPETQYRILRLDMLDNDRDKEFLIHFFDTTGAGYQLIILIDSTNNKLLYKGSALVGLEGMWDHSMPLIDTATATIWLKSGKTGMNASQFAYHVYKMQDTLQLVNTFLGYSLIREQFEGRVEIYSAECRYEVNPAYSEITQFTQLECGVDREGLMKNKVIFSKQNLKLSYLGNFSKEFACINLYGDTIEKPIDAKGFDDLYKKGRIAESTTTCPGKEQTPENIGTSIRYRLKLKNHLVETSQYYYGQDSSNETTAYLYKNRIVNIDGQRFDLEKWYKKQFSQSLYEGCYMSECIELYEYIDHTEVHVRLYNTGCCCGFCADYQIAIIQLFRNSTPKVSFFYNPINEYWRNW